MTSEEGITKMVKGRERTTKFYFKNEKEVMQELGLVPTKGSGSSWLEKEDGSNDYVIAQLKSTDKASYKLNQLDLEKLEYNAAVSSKVPMFVIQFLNNDSRYALMAIEDIPKIAQYINTGYIEEADRMPMMDLEDVKPKRKKKPKIVNSKSARDQFFTEKQDAWENRRFNK